MHARKNGRTHETMKSWDQIATGPHKNHPMSPQQRQAQFGDLWYAVQTISGGPYTILTLQHPDFGQAHRTRMGSHSLQGATASQTEYQCEKPPYPRKMFFFRARSRVLRSEREVWNTTLVVDTAFVFICFQLHDASTSPSDFFCGAAIFSVYFVVEVEELRWKQSNH